MSEQDTIPKNVSLPTDIERLAYQFTIEPRFLHVPDKLDNGFCTLINWRDDFYCYQNGVYVKKGKAEMRVLATQFLVRMNQAIMESEPELRVIKITTQKIAAFLLCVQACTHLPESKDLNTWIKNETNRHGYFLAMGNGILNFEPVKKNEKPELLEHNPRFFTLTKLPYDYDPDAKCDLWRAFLNDIMLSDTGLVRLLQQWTGYLLTPGLGKQRFLMCSGEGANGKGVFFKTVELLLGKSNCSQVSIANFGNQFALAETIGKLVNMSNETTHVIDEQAENVLKAYSAGDRLTFSRKFKEDITAIPTAKIMIATNNLPRFNDKTLAVWRRVLLVPFKKTIPKEQLIEEMENEFIPELPGIFNWAIDGLIDLNRNGFIEPENSNELLEEHRQESDPARAFLLLHYRERTVDDCPIINDSEWLDTQRVYEAYRKFCVDGGYSPTNDANFGKQVKRLFPNVTKNRIRKNSKLTYVYNGLIEQE